MLVTYFPEQVSMAGKPVMAKFIASIAKTDTVLTNTMEADIAVIWSVLWQGRMQYNHQVYQSFRSKNKPVVILETGNLCRGKTYKVCINNINVRGIHAGQFVEGDRLPKFASLFKTVRGGENIIICCQQQNSLLWNGQPSVDKWLHDLITKIRASSNRHIELRPHPRQQSVDFHSVAARYKRTTVVQPVRNYKNDTADFDAALQRAHCVIGHNAGSVIEAAVKYIPIVADVSSLCNSISNNIDCIDHASILTNENWLKFIVSTEWFEEEIADGTPWLALRSNVLHAKC
jgi:hypothetical protein